MKTSFSILIIIVLALLVGAGGYFYMQRSSDITIQDNDQGAQVATTTDPVVEAPVVDKTKTVIGTSVKGADIVAYHFGTGEKELLFVGGIHGGYEWNTVLVAQQLIEYLKANPSVIPADQKITVIPVLNPDGLESVVGTTTGNFSASDVAPSQATQAAGRFNANTVDLNRNFDCDWKATGVWQNKPVSGGSAAFSEPESKAIQQYISANTPVAAVVWYSSAGGVYSSSCGGAVSAETKALTTTFAKASGYPSYASFDSYATTGDMVNWLAKNNVPAISVLLTNHTDTEWTKNLAGVKAVMAQYSK